MAVKKGSTPKTTGTPKAASTKKAATAEKATTTKKAPATKAPATKAPAKKSSTTKAPAKKATKPAVAKKAAAVKLSDSQTRVLGAVQQAPEAGYAAGKGEAKVLESLLNKKLVKRGKKVDGTVRYLATKAGAKHLSSATSSSLPSIPAAPDASVVAPA